MSSSADKIAAELARQVAEKFSGTVEIPNGLTEDQAVAHMIEAYRKETEIELSEADVRAEVPNEMAGRETT